jgi:hypothetical protein
MANVAISILRRLLKRFSLGALFIYLVRFGGRLILNISRVMISRAIPGFPLNGLMSGQDRRLENVAAPSGLSVNPSKVWMENS